MTNNFKKKQKSQILKSDSVAFFTRTNNIVFILKFQEVKRILNTTIFPEEKKMLRYILQERRNFPRGKIPKETGYIYNI